MLSSYQIMCCSTGLLFFRSTAPFNNMRTLKFKAQLTNTFFRYRQSNVRQLLPTPENCRARGYQIVEHSSDNETVLGSSRKLRGVPEHLIHGSEKRICRLTFEFRVRMLLKSAVIARSRRTHTHFNILSVGGCKE